MKLQKTPIKTISRYFAKLQAKYPYTPGERGIRTEEEENFQKLTKNLQSQTLEK